MLYFKKFNVKKILILKKPIKNLFFDYYFYFSSLDFFKEFYINYYIFELYLNYLNNKYILINKLFFKKNLNKIFLLK
jgi:hypothetical protein